MGAALGDTPLSGFVYVVDDDAAFRRAIERRLKIAGYAVASYPSAQHLLCPAIMSWVASSLMSGCQG